MIVPGQYRNFDYKPLSEHHSQLLVFVPDLRLRRSLGKMLYQIDLVDSHGRLSQFVVENTE